VRVILCDDEPSIRLLFRTAFERFGADVHEATDGEACLALAATIPPDVVVLDLMMPRLDGLATLPRLKVIAPAAAIFVVTAHAGPDALQQGLAWGADAAFDKLAFLERIPDLLAKLGISA